MIASRPVLIRRITATVLLAASLALGCSPAERERQPGQDGATSDSLARTTQPPWYSRARALDLTGDAQPDTARLQAMGTRPDSLQITLTLIVDGVEKHRESWGSSYELTLVDSSTRAGPQVDAILRARLDSVLASVIIQRFGAPGVRIMPEDSAILAGIQPPPTHRLSFAYGFETTVRLAWDAPRQRFVRLWSCC